MTDVKQHEYDLLNEIAQDSLVTQANLSVRLGIAVGTVNWYIKRLVHRGWVKVTHLDRTRLQYDLTPEGLAVFTQRALFYARDSLKIYTEFRNKAKAVVHHLEAQGVRQVHIRGNDELMDILRLTCIEAGLQLLETPGTVTLTVEGQEYRILTATALAADIKSKE